MQLNGKSSDVQVLQKAHLVVAAEGLVDPAALSDGGGKPAVVRAVMPPDTGQERRGENALPHGLCSDAGFNHLLCCSGLQTRHVFLFMLTLGKLSDATSEQRPDRRGFSRPQNVMQEQEVFWMYVYLGVFQISIFQQKKLDRNFTY